MSGRIFVDYDSSDDPVPARKPAMKRMSIAEQTLKKQIDLLYLKREAVRQEIGKLQEQETVYTSMIFDIETEQGRLRTLRESSSERNTKP